MARKRDFFIKGSIMLPLAFFAGSMLASDDGEKQDKSLEQIEEVVVTGSYLRKTTADSASPLSIVTRVEIEEIGAVDFKDIINNLTFNSGSINNSTPFNGGDLSQGNISINLRNLGNGSTLVLMNGRRNVTTNFDNAGNGYVDVSGLIPTIAIERVEIVKDGSSALYGSDAIAGVVNFLTRKDFEGFDLQVDFATDDQTGIQDDRQISAILGASGDRGSAVVSVSYLDRKGLGMGDRFDRFGRSGPSGFGQPGSYVPLGAVTPDASSPFVPGGSTSFGDIADPDCDLVAADDGPKGVLGKVGGSCIYDFSSLFQLVAPQKQAKAYASATYDYSESLQFWGEASYSNNEIKRGNSIFPDVTFAIVPTNSPGLMLDAARRGINPVPYLALQRLLGGTDDSTLEDRPVIPISNYDKQFSRAAVGFTSDILVSDKSWTVDGSVASSRFNYLDLIPADTIASNMDAAYVGFGGPECRRDSPGEFAGSGNVGQGSCFFYNPFQTSRFDPVTGARWDTSDNSVWAGDPSGETTVAEAALLYQNPDELYRWLVGELQFYVKSEQTVYDVVLTGDLAQTKAGPIGLAVGAQYRNEKISYNYDSNFNNNNYKFAFGSQDWDGELTTTAFFVETRVPVADWVEVNLATRYENFDEIGADTIDPKVSVLLSPTEDLTLRGSWGTSFRIGSLLQLRGQQTTFSNSSDAFSATSGLAFRPTLTYGNPDLEPEEATAVNFGLSWSPRDSVLEGLSVDLDYWSYDYKDIITREAHQELIDEDNASRCPNGVNTDITAGPLCGVQPDGQIVSIGPGMPDKVIRSASGNLLRTQASYVNAQSLNAAGIDAAFAYTWNWANVVRFRAGLNVSYILEYDLATPSGKKIDGVGSLNAGNSVGHPLPKYKANFSLGFDRDRHSIHFLVNHIDSYKDDLPQNALRGSFIGFAPTIDSMTTLNGQYSYQLPVMRFLGEQSRITFGIKNITDEEPPLVNTDGGFDPFTHDPRGRIWYTQFMVSM